MPASGVLGLLACQGTCKLNKSKIHVAPVAPKTLQLRTAIPKRPPHMHLAIGGDVLVKSFNLKELKDRRAAYVEAAQTEKDSGRNPADAAAQQQQQPQKFPFSSYDSLHLHLLKLWQTIVSQKVDKTDPKAAEAALQDIIRQYCRDHDLPYNAEFYAFNLVEFIYPHTLPKRAPKLFRIKAALSCQGLLALWHVPKELEEAWLAESQQAFVQGNYSGEMLAQLEACSSVLFWSSVVPRDVMHLLQLLKSVETQQSSSQNTTGFRCTVMGLGERVTFLLLALQLHGDPLGLLLRVERTLLQKPHYPLHLVEGSCLNPGKGLAMPQGAVVFLVDNWHIPGFDSLEDTPLKDRLKTLFAKEADLTSLSGFARVRATGFACIPLVDPSDDKHISGVMEELTSLLKIAAVPFEVFTTQSRPHSLVLQQARKQQQTFMRVLERADTFRRWWSTLTWQESQKIIMQHRGRIDVQKFVTILLSTPVPRCIMYRSAVDQLYTAVLPASVRQVAERQKPTLQCCEQQQQEQQPEAAPPGVPDGDLTGNAASAAAVTISSQGCSGSCTASANAVVASCHVMGSVRMSAPNNSSAASGGQLPKVATPKRQYICAPKSVTASMTGVDSSSSRTTTDPDADTSPTTEQPRRRQKTKDSTHSNGAGHMSASAAAAGAASVAIGSMTADLYAPGPAAPPPDGNHNPDQAPDVIIPAYHFIVGGSRSINARLERHGSEPTAAADLLDAGSQCQDLVRRMMQEKRLHVEFSHTKAIGKQEVGAERVMSGLGHVWGALLVVGHNGEELSQLLDRGKKQLAGGELTSSHYCRSRAADFNTDLDLPYMFVESIMRTDTITSQSGAKVPCCYPHRGDGSLDVKVSAKDKQQLIACREALFQITLVLMLLWHTQNKDRHPDLQALADRLSLQPVAPQLPAQTRETSTAGPRSQVQQGINRL